MEPEMWCVEESCFNVFEAQVGCLVSTEGAEFVFHWYIFKSWWFNEFNYDRYFLLPPPPGPPLLVSGLITCFHYNLVLFLMPPINLFLFYAFFCLFNIFVVQDNYLEEAIKMRNLLEEFRGNHGLRPPTILGVREHVFTGRFVILISDTRYYTLFCI